MKFSLFYVYLNSALLCIFVDWIELIFIHSFLLVLFFFSCLVLYVVSVVDLAKLLGSPTTAQVVKTRHFSTVNNKRKKLSFNIYPPEHVVKSNNKKSLMSKAVLRQFCFGILTPKAFSYKLLFCANKAGKKWSEKKEPTRKT